VASLIPFDVFHKIDVALPYLQGLLRRLYAPKVDLRLARSRQLGIILPSNINNGPTLLEHIEGLLLYVGGIPHQHVGLVTAGGNEGV